MTEKPEAGQRREGEPIEARLEFVTRAHCHLCEIMEERMYPLTLDGLQEAMRRLT